MPQAESVALPKRLPLVISPENRAESVDRDSRMINCFLEKEKDGEIWIYERPGLAQHSRPSGGNAEGRGVYNWQGDIYSIFDDTLYKNAAPIAGTVDTTNGVYRFSSSMGATPRLQLGNGIKGYNYDTGAGLVQITDVDFPTAFRKGWAYLDGTAYVLTPTAHVQGSDINDTINWDPVNDIMAQIEPDQGVATAKQLVYVVIFKQWTTEIFYDAGNPTGSPLAPVQGAKVDYGCAHQDSVQDINGALVWLAASRDAGLQVVSLVRLKAEVVSFPSIDRLLQNADLSTVYSWQVKVGSHRFYVLTLVEENLTLAYDLTEKNWYQWADTDGNYMPLVSSTFTSDFKAIVQHATNGRLYEMTMTAATDDSDLIQVDLYTPNFDAGTGRGKMLSQLRLIAEQGEGSLLQVRTNDHDYDPHKWTSWRELDMSQKYPYLSDCGSFVKRAHNLRHRRPVRMPRIQAVELQMDICTL